MSLAPFFDKAPSIINKPDGSVLFECMCNANPEPTMQWFFKLYCICIYFCPIIELYRIRRPRNVYELVMSPILLPVKGFPRPSLPITAPLIKSTWPPKPERKRFPTESAAIEAVLDRFPKIKRQKTQYQISELIRILLKFIN
uniref:Uncharacterized protein n=1 Tax=Wuchereria bancrofti TaxID=6293 RepID=A0AAF5Q3K1_WUCBA